MSSEKHPFGGIIPDNARAVDGWVDGDAHYYPLLVQFEDTDAGGIVYHANYLSLPNVAGLAVVVITLSDNLYEKKTGFVVRRASLEYLRPASLAMKVVQTRLKELAKRVLWHHKSSHQHRTMRRQVKKHTWTYFCQC